MELASDVDVEAGVDGGLSIDCAMHNRTKGTEWFCRQWISVDRIQKHHTEVLQTIHHVHHCDPIKMLSLFILFICFQRTVHLPATWHWPTRFGDPTSPVAFVGRCRRRRYCYCPNRMESKKQSRKVFWCASIKPYITHMDNKNKKTQLGLQMISPFTYTHTHTHIGSHTHNLIV